MRYFFRNHKRTIKGVKIIALGIIILSSTGLLINSFTSEITDITALLGKANDTVIISPELTDVFSVLEYNRIDQIVRNSSAVSSSLSEQFTNGTIVINSINLTLPIHLVNITELSELVGYKGNLTLDFPASSFITDDLMDNSNIIFGEIYTIVSTVINLDNVSNYVGSFSFVKSISSDIKFINSGIYLDYNQFNQTVLRNMLRIQFKDDRKDDITIDKIQGLDNTRIVDSRPEADFLRRSANQIVRVLIILQSLISFLVILNIWNLFYQILYESKYDIRILLSIGYSKYQVRLLFMIISMVMGMFAFIISTTISYILVSTLLVTFSLFFNSSFLNIELTYYLLLFNFLNGFLISVIGAVGPIGKEVNL